jgi:hypothetical protein
MTLQVFVSDNVSDKDLGQRGPEHTPWKTRQPVRTIGNIGDHASADPSGLTDLWTWGVESSEGWNEDGVPFWNGIVPFRSTFEQEFAEGVPDLIGGFH